MGSRANLLIVENGAYRLFYSHWCAQTIQRELFWGPKHAVEFIRIQREVDKSGWLDEIWAEGAAVVDLDKRSLLFFGGESIDFDVPFRRVYLECLAKAWHPWTVRWAHEGIASIADYVKYPRSNVIVPPKQPSRLALRTTTDGWFSTVLSIRWSDTLMRFYPLLGFPHLYLLQGPWLLDEGKADDGLARMWWEEHTEFKNTLPIGGFHLDVPAKSLEYWDVRSAPSIANYVADAWPGWSVRWHRDRYESQLECTEGLLQFPRPSPDELKRELASNLLCDSVADMPESVVGVAETVRATGEKIEINPWALRDDRLSVPADVRRKMVAAFVGEFDDEPKTNALLSRFQKFFRSFTQSPNTL